MVVHALTKTCKWILYLLAALIILIALLLASVRLAVLYSDDYSEELASLVSSFVGSPVKIGEVDLVWNRFDANASLKDVQILSADGAETLLELPQVELQLDVRDVLLERRLSVRNIQLSELSLVASYEGQGQLRMLGRRLGRKISAPDSAASVNDEKIDQQAQAQRNTDASPDSNARNYSVLNWLFNAERISILDSEITLIDAMKDREYKVENVNIRAFNNGDQHQIRIVSALPGELGENSLAAFDFTGDADKISEWQGQFYVNTKGLNIVELADVWQAPHQEFAGQAELQVWGTWNGTRINKVRTLVSATDLQLQQTSSSGAFNANLQVDQFNVDLDWFRLDSGWQLTFNQLTGKLDNTDLMLSGLEMQLTREVDEDYFSMTGPDIDLQSLRPVFSYVDAMLPNDLAFRAHALRHGLLADWRVSGLVTDDNKTLTELHVNAVDLTIDPYDKTPGISGLTASLAYEDGTGRITLNNQDVSLSLPELFDRSLPPVNVDGVINFLVNTETVADEVVEAVSAGQEVSSSPGLKWRAVTKDLRVASLDFETSSVLSISGHSDGSQMIDSHTTVLSANVPRLKDYFPVRKIKPKLLNWLQTAIVGGDVVRGRVEVKGNLADFSPVNGRGHFYAEADLVDATVKFKPDWPAVTDMDGNLSFSSSSMRGRVYEGSIRQARFSDARLFLPDFKQPIIEVQANAIGPLADALDFLQTGPLSPKIGKIFGNSTGSGSSRLALDLKIPLRKELRNELTVDGEVLLDNAQITSAAYGVDLESATGKLRFNRRGVTVDEMLVRYQGLPLKVNAIQESNSENHLNRIRISGPVAIASVMQSYDIPLVDEFEGTSDWNIDIDVTRPLKSVRSRVELTATSDLAGTKLNFPVPFNKGSAELRRARVYRDFGAAEKDWWIELPGLMKTRVRTGDGEDTKLESMVIALGDSANKVLPWRGISIQGDAHRLDATGWVQFATKLKTRQQGNGESFPLFAKVSTRQMAIGNEVFDDLVYIAYRDGGAQVHRVESTLVSGEVRLQQRRAAAEPLVFRLDRLDKRLLVAIAKAAREKRAAGEVTIPSPHPRDIPPLDIRVSELIWDSWRFAKVALRTQPGDVGMEISALTARQNAMRLSGRGYWRQDDNSGGASDLTTLDLTASFDDFGRAMGDIAKVRSFAKGTGEAALSLRWPNPAYAPRLDQLQGQFLFNLRDGRILSVQPGAGRILGLFALQSLPRRLTLDFRDITENGLAYTGVSGNLSIANGQALANAIAMSGPVAEILIHGNTNFVDKTYDQTIDVLPRVSGALPLLGVLSGGPAAGVSALLAGGVLKGLGVNLDEIGRQRLSLTGSWSVPVWTNINQSIGGSR